MIFETIVITVNSQNQPHIAPFGVRYAQDKVIISPYRPSQTLDNIVATKTATLNITDDVRIFAGALTGNTNNDALQANIHKGYRLANALSHTELALLEVKHDDLRPQLIMQKVAELHHKSFTGFNRAQAAVIELCILVSRLHMLPKDKVMLEMKYLQIAIDKTAGERELEAWGWLAEKIDHFYASN
jgi:uncharacterized protein